MPKLSLSHQRSHVQLMSTHVGFHHCLVDLLCWVWPAPGGLWSLCFEKQWCACGIISSEYSYFCTEAYTYASKKKKSCCMNGWCIVRAFLLMSYSLVCICMWHRIDLSIVDRWLTGIAGQFSWITSLRLIDLLLEKGPLDYQHNHIAPRENSKLMLVLWYGDWQWRS